MLTEGIGTFAPWTPTCERDSYWG